jgi:hypothetical protein
MTDIKKIEEELLAYKKEKIRRFQDEIDVLLGHEEFGSLTIAEVLGVFEVTKYALLKNNFGDE